MKTISTARRISLATSLSLLLVGCGGGGGSTPPPGSSPPPPPPVAQSIAFATAGPIAKTFGDAAFTNAASGGAGTGAITYSSGSSAVAAVDGASGQVTIASAGSTVITATKAADAGHLAANATYTINVAPAPQSIAFATAGPIGKRIGDPVFTNLAAGGAGSGAIAYASNNPAVAAIDAASGAVTLGAAGTAIITATKAASANHLAALTTYTINVSGPLAKARFTAWVGQNDTQINWPAAAIGAEFIRGSVALCATLAPASCSTSTTSTIGASSSIDSVAQLPLQTRYWLKRGTDVSLPVTVTRGAMPAAFDPLPVVFDRQLWLINTPADGSTWSSTDGRAWARRAPVPAFGPRLRAQAVVFNDRIWLIGGAKTGNAYTPTNDVWSSTDGLTWTQVTAAAAFPPRARHQVAVLNGRLWVVGGGNDQVGPLYNDVWSSTDGINWTPVLANLPFAARWDFRMVSFNGRLWILGGNFGFNDFNEAWSSADGVNWRSETPVGGRIRFAAAVLGNRLYVHGGRSNLSVLDGLIYTEDGVTWLPAPVTPFGGRTEHALVAFDDRLWMLGGIANGGNSNSDAWSTADGAAWRFEHSGNPGPMGGSFAPIEFGGHFILFGPGADNKTYSLIGDGEQFSVSPEAANIPSRALFANVFFNGRLWIRGGLGVPGDLWSSADGSAWTQTAMTPAVPRSGHAMYALNGRMFMLGGYAGAGGSINGEADIWSSADGATWVRDVTNGPFGPRYGHAITVFNGRAWLMGGANGLAASRPEIWSSADGLAWTLETTNTVVAARNFAQLVVFKNRLWIIGGLDPAGVALNDVWSSADGVTWIRETAAAGFSPRRYHRVAQWNGRLWLMGGYGDLFDSDSGNELWSSEDGVNWRLRFSSEIEIP